MDTKLKKFDRTVISKTIAFLLAMLFTMLSVVKVIEVYDDLSYNHENVTYYKNLFTQGEKFDLTTSEMFYSELKNFTEIAYKNTVLYPKPYEKSYGEYQKNIKALLKNFAENEKKELKNKINKERTSIYRAETLECINCSYITLEKIADHKNHSFSDGTFCYALGDTFFRNQNGNETSIYDDGEITAYTHDVAFVGTETQSSKKDNFFDENDNLLFSFTEPSEIPNSIIQQGIDADGVIELCRTAIGSKYYDGYYKYKVTDRYTRSRWNDYVSESEYLGTVSNAAQRISEGESGDDLVVEGFFEYFENFGEFELKAENTAKDLARYKNMTFCLIDNKTNKVLATTVRGTNKNMTADEALSVYSKSPWFISKNFETGKTDCSLNLENSFLSLEDNILSTQSPYTLVVCFDTDLQSEDMFSTMGEKYILIYNELKSDAIEVSVYLLLVLLCVIYLVIRSGRKHGDREIHMLWTDKIFVLTRTVITGIIIASAVGIFFALSGEFFVETSIAYRITAGLCAMTIVALLIDWLCFIARNIKNHTFFKNNFVYWIVNRFKTDYLKHKAKLDARPPVYRDIFNDVMRKTTFGIFIPNLLLGLLIFFLICVDAFLLGIFSLILLFIYDLFALFYIIRYAYAFRKILYALNQIRQGNYNVTIDKASMPQSVKAYASDVEALKEGLIVAVENAVKEQKTKTELITNVSHDLKTPLTSIITYVDLLSRCEIENKDAKAYIEVLGDKSARLKRLIEDLVEASKASTGNVQVNLIKVSLKELTAQIVGEYEDELEAKNLQLVLNVPNEDIIVTADSRMSYRILDNLLSNVKKYAMPRTRVYVDVLKENGKGVITVRNISERPLNIAPEELTARFVRGDESRSTEGNGLGLSIADNFAKLQGGKLTLSIDGDMFTARVEYAQEQ